MLLGPAGVGLVGIFRSMLELVKSGTSLGVNASAVREIAKADAEGTEKDRVGVVVTLFRTCLLLGLVGLLFVVVCADWLSIWSFGQSNYTAEIRTLGVVVMLSSLAGGLSAYLQGKRKITDMARASLISSFLGAIISVTLYLTLGVAGIVPVMVCTSLSTLLIYGWFARKIPRKKLLITWKESIGYSKDLMTLGFALMWGGLLTALVAFASRALIIKELGIDENGIFQAAWAISGMFAGFVLGAMSSDYYPHLTSIVGDRDKANQLINNQVEIGILLALPGLLGTLLFAPWIMQILYSSEFLPAAQLLPWLLIGIYARVMIWPLGFLVLAKGKTKWFVSAQTLFHGIHYTLIYTLLPRYGLQGVAFAFFVPFVSGGIINLLFAYQLTSYRPNKKALVLSLLGGVSIIGGCVVHFYTEHWVRFIIAVIFVGLVSILCLRSLCLRLGEEHRIVKMLGRLPLVHGMFYKH